MDGLERAEVELAMLWDVVARLVGLIKTAGWETALTKGLIFKIFKSLYVTIYTSDGFEIPIYLAHQ